MSECKPPCPLWCYPIHHKWIPRLLFVSDEINILQADKKFVEEFPQHSKFGGISTVKGEIDLCDLFSHEFTAFHDWEATTQAIHHYH